MAQNNVLPNVKNLIAVASGKGGVGKSTISVNLAVSLQKKGYKTGIIDADIFGPSLPKMLGAEGDAPQVKKEGGKELIVPVEKYGIKMLSIGFFIKPDDAVVWRGPMASNGLKQLLTQADWGELDFLIIDLPPGTSDIHLTLVQTVPVTGAVIVSTPQDVALADAVKGISMFRSEKINVPVLGIVENMAWFTPKELPDNKYYIFGKGGCKKLAERMNTKVLAQIPLVQSVREGGDKGKPAASDQNSELNKEFLELAENVAKATEERNFKLDMTKIVKTDK